MILWHRLVHHVTVRGTMRNGLRWHECSCGKTWVR
jgi:hypothetical protein